MEDKYAKEIAKELRLIRQELQKLNEPKVVGPLVFHQTTDLGEQPEEESELEFDEVGFPKPVSGERVSF